MITLVDVFVQVGFEGAGLRSVAAIRVPGRFGEELVGMCGNCDGRMNDMKTRDGTNVDDENDRFVINIVIFTLTHIFFPKMDRCRYFEAASQELKLHTLVADLHCRILTRIPARTRIPVLCKYYGKGIRVWIRTNMKSFCTVLCSHRVWSPNPNPSPAM